MQSVLFHICLEYIIEVQNMKSLSGHKRDQFFMKDLIVYIPVLIQGTLDPGVEQNYKYRYMVLLGQIR